MSDDSTIERYAEYLGDADGVTWTIERDPQLRLTFVAIALLDRAPDWDRLLRRVDRASRVIPRLRQRVVETPFRLAPPRWVVDPHFDLRYHLRRVQAPAPGDRGALLELARVAGMSGFDRTRPLWEFTLVEGLEGGRAAFVQKIHHSLTDGLGGIRLALELYEPTREPDEIEVIPAAPAGERFTRRELTRLGARYSAQRLGSHLKALAPRAGRTALRTLRDPSGALDRARAMTSSIGRVLAPESEVLSPIMLGRSTTWHYALVERPLEQLRAAGHAGGGTVNHAFVAAIAGGLARYHEAHDAPVDALRMTMPISYRRPGDPLGGNRYLPARLTVPMTITDAAERIRVVGEICRSWQHEPALPITDAIAAVLNVLPAQVTTVVIGSMVKADDCTTSDVPGLAGPVFLAGSQIDRLFACGSPSGTPADVLLISHGDIACVGVTIDVAAVPDPDVFVACLEAGFDEVLSLAPAAPAAVHR